MQVFLILVVVAAALAALWALIRGLVQFLKQTEDDLKGDGTAAGLRQNKMMVRRIQFQAIAVLVAALLMYAFASGS